MIRRPAVAGSFYPEDPEALRRDLEALTGDRRPAAAAAATGILVPHAGYVYSGRIAAATYAAVSLPRAFVILGPNHTGAGEPVAVADDGAWRTPLGEAPIDKDLARAVLARCRAAAADPEAHRREHSLEVQIPFLQHLARALRFVPICVGTLRLEVLLDLGRAVAEAVRASETGALLVISSDLSHYLPAGVAESQDRKAIDRILAVDPEGLHRVVQQEGISMCGVAPAVAGLEAARRLGARSGRLVAYGNSGDSSGDYGSVVGYAGVVLAP
jgi:hypothetical protein